MAKNRTLTVKLQNIPEGQSNVNGRVYTKEALDCMVRSTAEEPVLVQVGQAEPNNPVDLRATVGRAKVVRKDDGHYIEVTLIGKGGADIVEALGDGKLVAVTDGMGKASMRTDGITVVEDFTLKHIMLITPEKAGLKPEEVISHRTEEGR